MSSWYNKIVANLENLPAFLEFYNDEIVICQNEIKIKGNIEKNLASLPGITEHCFTGLQEIEAVLQFLNIELKKIQRKHFQKYFEHYNRALTSREVEKYCSGEPEILEYEMLINEVALLRNKFLALMKGLESKNFMLGHIVKLKAAGFDDYNIL